MEERPNPPGGQDAAVPDLGSHSPLGPHPRRGASTEHPNGATGGSRLLIAVRNATDARRTFAALIGGGLPKEPEDVFRVGRHGFAFLTPEASNDPVERRLEALGPGPFAIELAAAEEHVMELSPELTQGARMLLGRA